jgi:triacylglycerol lipase
MAAQLPYSTPNSPDGYLGVYPIGRPVVLTPGYMDDANKLAWTASFFRRNGLHTVVISPQPSDASVGIDALAEKLAAEIERELGPDQPFDFLGFSMGGLIGRYYLQHLGGDARVQRLVTVATPHRGTLTARLLPQRPALAQMYPDSDFLTDLNRDLTPLTQRDFMAFWTPFDLSVTPSYNCYLPELPATRLYSPFHATLLHDPVVMREVVNFFLITAADRSAAAH